MENPRLRVGGRSMIMRGIIGLTLAAGLSACSGVPVTDAPMQAKLGDFSQSYEGVDYSAAVLAGPTGKVLTANGALPASGHTVRVAPLAMDQGKRAKDIATLACAQAGGRFNAAAIGGFAAGAWVFEGGCA